MSLRQKSSRKNGKEKDERWKIVSYNCYVYHREYIYLNSGINRGRQMDGRDRLPHSMRPRLGHLDTRVNTFLFLFSAAWIPPPPGFIRPQSKRDGGALLSETLVIESEWRMMME
ncbi:hypothetical protein OUZ56_002990 [Daphnia magna]|uniref:Uncharacterized protein n=1 Tax=Daphnia magna TaxID=35525 RepID=A0ABR0A7E7_9CRUS|nr:hypothetical protein OUZ56_002990 [Daphnia magna]